MAPETTRYTKRDLRAVDMLAIILIGVGVLVTGLGVVQLATGSGHGKAAVSARAEKAAGLPALAPEGKVPAKGAALPRGVVSLLVGTAFLLLGAALGFKVRSLIRSGGYEAAEYEGVPDV